MTVERNQDINESVCKHFPGSCGVSGSVLGGRWQAVKACLQGLHKSEGRDWDVICVHKMLPANSEALLIGAPLLSESLDPLNGWQFTLEKGFLNL